MKKEIRRTLGLFVVVGLVAAVPAFAVNAIAGHPSDPSYAEMRNNINMRVCDRDVDGHRVRAWYYTNLQYPNEPTYSAWAPSGGCSEFQGTSWGLPAARFRVCIEVEGCGPWWIR